MSPAIEITDAAAAYPIARLVRPSVRTLGTLAFLRRQRGELLWALRDISLRVEPTERVGLVGANGAGKSTLLRLLAGVLRPARGRVVVRGSVAPLIDLGAGLDPTATAAENVVLYGALLGRDPRHLEGEVDGILAWAGLEAYADVAIEAFSAGMIARLAFAVATSGEPKVVLVDEALGVGDSAFFAKSVERLTALARNGSTLVIASHAPDQLRAVTARAILLDQGRLVADGPTPDILELYAQLPPAPLEPRTSG